MRQTVGSDDRGDSPDEPEDLAHSFPYHVWAFGIGIPLALGMYGIYCLAAQSAWFLVIRPAEHWWESDRDFSRIGFLLYEGSSAMALGFAYTSAALFLHFRAFWTSWNQFQRYGTIGEVIAGIGVAWGMLAFILSAVFSAFRF